jgi:hypothetical protein
MAQHHTPLLIVPLALEFDLIQTEPFDEVGAPLDFAFLDQPIKILRAHPVFFLKRVQVRLNGMNTLDQFFQRHRSYLRGNDSRARGQRQHPWSVVCGRWLSATGFRPGGIITGGSGVLAMAIEQLYEQHIKPLPATEQRRLVEKIVRALATQSAADKPVERCDWMFVRGTLAYPLCGEDSQAWVSCTRRQAEER